MPVKGQCEKCGENLAFAPVGLVVISTCRACGQTHRRELYEFEAPRHDKANEEKKG